VRILLDTQCWLWMLAEPERLQPAARAQVSERRNELVLSVASLWEIAIKIGLGKLTLPGRPAMYLPPLFERSGVSVLPIQAEHALAVVDLPLHHRDPFDRLLVAVAKVERLPILTADRTFEDYDVEILRT
jgi:PIN domain nuclease of toxin-antitoxin system